jgi:hypothetical protein
VQFSSHTKRMRAGRSTSKAYNDTVKAIRRHNMQRSRLSSHPPTCCLSRVMNLPPSSPKLR